MAKKSTKAINKEQEINKDAIEKKESPLRLYEAKSERNIGVIESIFEPILTTGLFIATTLMGGFFLAYMCAGALGLMAVTHILKTIVVHKEVKDILKKNPNLKNMSRKNLLKEGERLNTLYKEWSQRKEEDKEVGFEEWLNKEQIKEISESFHKETQVVINANQPQTTNQKNKDKEY